MFPDTLINIGDKGYVNLYGICIALGVILCMLCLKFMAKKMGVNKDLIEFTETTGYIAVLAGFGGAFIFQQIYKFINSGMPFGDWWATKPWKSGGITFLGGLITGVATFLVVYFIRRKKLPGKLSDILPAIPSCICIAHGFGRIGCNFAGCCYGMDVTEAIDAGKWPSFLSFLHVDMSRAIGKGYEMCIPVQLMEAAVLLILAIVLAILVLKKKLFVTFPFYLATYGAWRFFAETIRDDARGKFVGNITPSQFWSLIMVLIAVPLFFLIRYWIKKYGTLEGFKEKGLIKETN